jgi:hypothetical protein
LSNKFWHLSLRSVCRALQPLKRCGCRSGFRALHYLQLLYILFSFAALRMSQYHRRRGKYSSDALPLAAMASGAYLAAGGLYFYHVMHREPPRAPDPPRAAEPQARRSTELIPAPEAVRAVAAARTVTGILAAAFAILSKKIPCIIPAQVYAAAMAAQAGMAPAVAEQIQFLAEEISHVRVVVGSHKLPRTGVQATRFEGNLGHPFKFDISKSMITATFLTMDVCQGAVFLGSSQPLFGAISAAGIFSIFLSRHYSDAPEQSSFTLMSCMCLLTKIYAMGLCTLCYGATDVMGRWDDFPGWNVGIWIVPMILFAYFYSYISSHNVGLFAMLKSMLKLSALIIAGAAILRGGSAYVTGKDHAVFSAPQMSAIRNIRHDGRVFSDTFLPKGGNVTTGAGPVERKSLVSHGRGAVFFEDRESITGCLFPSHRAPAQQECADKLNRRLKHATSDNHRLQLTIWSSLDTAPWRVQQYALQHIKFNEQSGVVEVEEGFFQHIVDAMSNNFEVYKDSRGPSRSIIPKYFQPTSQWMDHHIEAIGFIMTLASLPMLLVKRGNASAAAAEANDTDAAAEAGDTAAAAEAGDTDAAAEAGDTDAAAEAGDTDAAPEADLQ